MTDLRVVLVREGHDLLVYVCGTRGRLHLLVGGGEAGVADVVPGDGGRAVRGVRP